MENESADIIAKLKLLFEPQSVAFLGASTNPLKWGHRILANLVNGGFKGKVYPVNPNKGKILGLTVYGSVEGIPEIPDLAVIVVPPLSVVRAVEGCATKGIKTGVVITAGFAEIGTQGESLQQEIIEAARSGGMRLVGPNSDGIVNSSNKLYPQMPPIFPHPGPVSIISQSGNVAGTIQRMIVAKGFGCSKSISSGNEADLHCEDYLEYLAEDPQTKVILSYIEGFKNGLRFFQVAKEVSKKKPIVMLKSGETPAGARAAKSHTAALTGSDTVFEAMCKQTGIIRARDLDELVNIGLTFAHHPLPQGQRVGIVTAGGGWGVLAADACAKLGLEVVALPPDTIMELDSLLPAWWNRSNPVDLVAGAFGDAMIKSIEVLMRCPVVDGIIMLEIMPALPQEVFSSSYVNEEGEDHKQKTILMSSLQLFDQLDKLTKRYRKPTIVASEPPFPNTSFAAEFIYTLGQNNFVCHSKPHQAAAAFASLAKYNEYLKHENA